MATSLAAAVAALSCLATANTAATARPLRSTVARLAVDCSSPNPVVLSYRVDGHARFDRVVFTFSGGVPGRRASYRNAIIQDGTGAPVHLEGHAFLSIMFFPAVAYNANCRNTAAERSRTPRLRQIRQIKPAGDFEGYVSYGIGLRDRAHYHLFLRRDPDRLLLDIAH